jgi:hypothetical protein
VYYFLAALGERGALGGFIFLTAKNAKERKDSFVYNFTNIIKSLCIISWRLLANVAVYLFLTAPEGVP